MKQANALLILETNILNSWRSTDLGVIDAWGLYTDASHTWMRNGWMFLFFVVPHIVGACYSILSNYL